MVILFMTWNDGMIITSNRINVLFPFISIYRETICSSMFIILKRDVQDKPPPVAREASTSNQGRNRNCFFGPGMLYNTSRLIKNRHLTCSDFCFETVGIETWCFQALGGTKLHTQIEAMSNNIEEHCFNLLVPHWKNIRNISYSSTPRLWAAHPAFKVRLNRHLYPLGAGNSGGFIASPVSAGWLGHLKKYGQKMSKNMMENVQYWKPPSSFVKTHTIWMLWLLEVTHTPKWQL